MTNQINQDEINQILWRACDTFRGTVDPAEYKNYILVMLFVKYISDVWRDHRDQLVEKYSGDEERVQRAMRYEKFRLPAGCDFQTLYDQRNAANLGEIINIALDAIEEANKQKLEGVFRNIDFNSEAALGRTRQRNERLKNLLNDFSDPRLDLRPSRVGDLDIIGNAYEYLIGRFAAGAGKKAGEFYTPPEVSTLLAKLLAPQPGDRICDPACGSGSLLIKCAREVGSNDYALYGQENNGSTWALAKMNMFLHDVASARVDWGDTLRTPTLVDGDHLMRFNVVVANPPFSLDKWGRAGAEKDRYSRFFRGIPPRSRGDYAFITHMIEVTYIDPHQDGRVGMIAPHGVLFRGGTEGKIRRKLIEENLLDGVIGLPSNLFYGTSIPAVILLFKRQRSDGKVLFIDASRECGQDKAQNRLRSADVERILTVYHRRQSVEKYAYLANFQEIKENGFNLSIPRYVDTFEPDEPIDLFAVHQEIEGLQAELSRVQQKMDSFLDELQLHES
jgi:type I restriction enzyme M protein